jgi:spore coat polysaccharide biosynthesis predicted glycosyltransferase SpsG
MLIQIICRGSVEIGLGHLYRTRTFARQAAKSHDVEVMAIVPPDLEKIFKEESFKIHFTQSTAEIISFIKNKQQDVLIYDTTFIEDEIFPVSREQAGIIGSLSPVFNRLNDVDFAFNRADKPFPGVLTFCGIKYSIFNENVIKISSSEFEKSLSYDYLPVAICMGGADVSNHTLKVLEAIAKCATKLSIWLILGEGYSHCYNSLVSTINNCTHHEIIIAKTNVSSWRIMNHCALGILSGGLTTIEAVYAGLPTINIFKKIEHVDVTPSILFTENISVNAGLFNDESLSKLPDTIDNLNQKRDILFQMHKNSQNRVDSNGAQHVLNEIEKLAEKIPQQVLNR